MNFVACYAVTEFFSVEVKSLSAESADKVEIEPG